MQNGMRPADTSSRVSVQLQGLRLLPSVLQLASPSKCCGFGRCGGSWGSWGAALGSRSKWHDFRVAKSSGIQFPLSFPLSRFYTAKRVMSQLHVHTACSFRRLGRVESKCRSDRVYDKEMGWNGVLGIASVMLVYGLLVSGIVYDLVLAPPSSGQFVDSEGKGRVLPMRLGRANINRQYVIEGFSAGLLIVTGSIGILMLAVRLTVCPHFLLFQPPVQPTSSLAPYLRHAARAGGVSVLLTSCAFEPGTLRQTADAGNKTRQARAGDGARALHVVTGFIFFAVGFNALAGLMHRKLPSYMLQAA